MIRINEIEWRMIDRYTTIKDNHGRVKISGGSRYYVYLSIEGRLFKMHFSADIQEEIDVYVLMLIRALMKLKGIRDTYDI